MSILTWIRDHLDVLGPIVLPLAILLFDWCVKLERKKLELEFLGSDANLAGFALFFGIFVERLSSDHLVGGKVIASCVIFLMIQLVAWWTCFALGCRTFPLLGGWKHQPILALFVGSGMCYLGAISAWEIGR